MQTYLVGGAVRDSLLGLPVKDRDWVVINATPEDMLTAAYQQVGADFPVFLHPETQEEYALARTERKHGQGYQGFVCDFSPDVTLEEDLMRRDLTINAMAQKEDGSIIDPYRGQDDLDKRLLRHVSPAFQEDPLRILRVARFSARFHSLGFRVAEETMQLMTRMVANGELEHLVAERVWTETQRALGEAHPEVYFEVLKECGALAVWFPEVDQLFGVPQPEKYHPEIDTGLHVLLVLKQATKLSNSISVRWAALLHDLGKGVTPQENWPQHIAHEKLGVPLVKALCSRIKAPKDASQLALLVCEFHGHVHKAFELRPETILKLFDQLDVWRKPERFEDMLLACTADARGRPGFEQDAYPQAAYLRTALEQASTLTAQDAMKNGAQGREIRTELTKLRKQRLTTWKKEQLL